MTENIKGYRPIHSCLLTILILNIKSSISTLFQILLFLVIKCTQEDSTMNVGSGYRGGYKVG